MLLLKLIFFDLLYLSILYIIWETLLHRQFIFTIITAYTVEILLKEAINFTMMRLFLIKPLFIVE